MSELDPYRTPEDGGSKHSPPIISKGLRKYFNAALEKLDHIEFGDPSEYTSKKYNVEIAKTKLDKIWIAPVFKEHHDEGIEVSFKTFLNDPAPQLVLADPGCGKSTLSRLLTCKYTNNYKTGESDFFGIFIPLSMFRSHKGSIENEIAYCAAKFVGLEHDEDVLSELSKNMLNACLIFDGYDELPSSHSTSQNENSIATRSEVAEIIGMLPSNAEVHSNGEKKQRYIVLCRRVDYDGYANQLKLKGLTVRVMSRFPPRDMNDAVVNWHNSAIEKINKLSKVESKIAFELEKRSKEIQSVLKEHADLADICLTPFMLSALLTVDLDAKDLPSSVSQLCWRAVNWFFIDKHYEPEKISLVKEYRECILQAIVEIGRRLHERVIVRENLTPFNKSELRNFIEQAFKKNGYLKKLDEELVEKKITDILLFFKRGHGILINLATNDDYEFDFVHNIFREVIAGRWLLGESVVELTKYALDGGWYGPVRYWAGFKASEKDGIYTISSFVDQLSQKEVENNIHAIISCGEMLVEVISSVNQESLTYQLKNQISHTALKLCGLLKQNNLLLVQRIRIGDLLSVLEDPRLKSGIIDRISYINTGVHTIGRNSNHNTKINKKYEDCPASPIIDGHLKSFGISNYLVTNREFNEFVKDNGYTSQKYWDGDIAAKWARGDKETIEFLTIEASNVGKIHLTSELAGQRITEEQIPIRCRQMIERNLPMYWSDPAYNRPNQPVVGINWWEANAYCKWLEENLRKKSLIDDNKIVRLPIEAEWEVVSKFCGNGGVYPWLNGEPDKCALVKSAFPLPDESPLLMPQIRSCGVGLFDFLEVALPIYDLCGNVWEWTGSKVHIYSDLSFKQQIDFEGLGDRIARGSSWLSSEVESSQNTFRSFDPPYNAYEDLGFRIVIF